MKIVNSLLLALVILLASRIVAADTALHKFQYWGQLPKVEKLDIYVGWSNGFLLAKGPQGLMLADCLDQMTYDQALAMIDKRYKDHPELWSHLLGEQILEALTVDGGPCQGKNPLTPASSGITK